MLEKIKYLCTIIGGTLFIAIGVYFFMNPNHIVCGSVTGLAIVLIHFVPVSLSVMTLILNVICIILAFVFIDKTFGVKIIFVSLLLPVYLFVFEQIFPKVTSPTQSIALDVVCTVLVIAFGQAILFHANAASGGLDIIAKILSKYLYVDFGKALIGIGMVTVVSSYFAYDFQTVVISAITTYFDGLVIDYFVEGFTGKMRVSVISEYNEEIRQFVIEKLRRGITMYTIVGGYSGEIKNELTVILNKKEYGQLLDFVQSKDENAFISVSRINRVVGKWNAAVRGRMV